MIGIIVTVYSNYPEQLFDSCSKSDIPVRWYIFFHGTNDELENRLQDFSRGKTNVIYLPYKKNRGLSKSWNDGLRLSEGYGDEFTLIINDDLSFRENGFSQFIEYIRTLPYGYGIATVMGQESENSPASGQVIPQELACCVIGKAALDVIGYFDQNFTPAYFEDTDYMTRIRRAGLSIEIDQRILVDHDRSKTLRTDSTAKKIVQNAFGLNEAYYRAKWGGGGGGPEFQTPFNNPDLSLYISYEDADNPYPNTLKYSGNTNYNHGEMDLIGRELNTDKSSKVHGFLDHYDYLFSSRRDDISSILEVGVGSGSSLRLWEKYFPNAKIAAIDNNYNTLKFSSDRSEIFISDQSDIMRITNFLRQKEEFNIIIDDGSHVWGDQITFFKTAFPYLSRGGFFIIENIDTSYEKYVESFSKGSQLSMRDYLFQLTDIISGDGAINNFSVFDEFAISYARAIESIEFVRRGCIIRRK